MQARARDTLFLQSHDGLLRSLRALAAVYCLVSALRASPLRLPSRRPSWLPPIPAGPPVQSVPQQFLGSGVQERVRCYCVAEAFDRYALQVVACCLAQQPACVSACLAAWHPDSVPLWLKLRCSATVLIILIVYSIVVRATSSSPG